MEPEAIKDYYILNGDIKSTEDLEVFNKIVTPPIYEVIRIIRGVPLFLDEHLDRMFDSAKMINYELSRDKIKIKQDIKSLILKNNIKDLNIKLLSTEFKEIGKVFLVYFIKSFYPPKEYYEDGIKTILFHHERQNPNAKVLFTSFKEDVEKKLKEEDAFEALLVDKSGCIPEGSRSNIFFIRGNKIYTAPESEILLGITRKHILEICEELEIEIIEKTINKNDVSKLEGAFMSGTSVNVLPISAINQVKLNSVNNELIININKFYDKKMEDYIKLNKNK